MKIENSLVSVIIPVYNQESFIIETLESINKQTYENFECIIVDDGSDDNSIKLIKDFCIKNKKFKFYQRPIDRQSGGNAARNYGFEVSKGSFVNWFDADDLMSKDFLEYKIKNIDSKHDFIITSGIFIDELGNRTGEFKFCLNDYLYKRYSRYSMLIITANIMFKREYLKGKKLFDENIFRLQENEFFTRLFFSVKEDQYVCLNHKSLLYRRHKNTITERDKIYNKKFKISLSYNYINNFRRSYILKDKDLINYYYQLIVFLFFESKSNDDFYNMKYISTNIINQYNKDSIKIRIIVFMFFWLQNFNKLHYRIKYFLLNQVL